VKGRKQITIVLQFTKVIRALQFNKENLIRELLIYCFLNDNAGPNVMQLFSVIQHLFKATKHLRVMLPGEFIQVMRANYKLLLLDFEIRFQLLL